MKKEQTIKSIKEFSFMILACICYALSTVLFLAPNSIVAGGMTGLSVLINIIIDDLIPIGTIFILANIPVLILGIRYCGIKFVLKCLITVTSLGLITDLLGLFLYKFTDDYILASLYGGICQGIGIGLFIKYKFSSGGTELLGRVISKWTKISNIPIFVGLLDGIIVILGSIFTQNPNNMLYALIVIFVSTKVSEVVLMGLERSKVCIIVSDKGDEISKVLLENSPRGVTMLNGIGMYTKKEHEILLSCVKNRQLTQLKEIVKSIDPSAFIMINDAVEVRGKGFKDISENE